MCLCKGSFSIVRDCGLYCACALQDLAVYDYISSHEICTIYKTHLDICSTSVETLKIFCKYRPSCSVCFLFFREIISCAMLNNRERWHQRSNFLVVLFLISVPLKTNLDWK